jgi:very-short-patch-repair endonuclease
MTSNHHEFKGMALPRLLTREHARALGMPDTMIRSRRRTGRWQAITRDVFLTLPPATRMDRIAAAALMGGRYGVVSGAAAVRVWGLRPRREGAHVLALVPRDFGRRDSSWIRYRRTTRLPRASIVHGIRVAPVARAVADHALEVARLDDVRAIVAEAVQRGLATPRDLEAEYAAGPRNDSKRLRIAVEDLTAGARSAPEGRAARSLRKAKLDGFVQNAEIRVGTRSFVADFLWEEVGAILEIDSREYHFTERDWQQTLRRDQILQSAGYAVLHVTPAQLHDEAEFIAIVRAWLDSLAVRRDHSRVRGRFLPAMQG